MHPLISNFAPLLVLNLDFTSALPQQEIYRHNTRGALPSCPHLPAPASGYPALVGPKPSDIYPDLSTLCIGHPRSPFHGPPSFLCHCSTERFGLHAMLTCHPPDSWLETAPRETRELEHSCLTLCGCEGSDESEGSESQEDWGFVDLDMVRGPRTPGRESIGEDLYCYEKGCDGWGTCNSMESSGSCGDRVCRTRRRRGGGFGKGNCVARAALGIAGLSLGGKRAVEGEDWGCACNATYVSKGCCESGNGLVWEESGHMGEVGGDGV